MKTQKNNPCRMKLKEVFVMVLVLLSVQAFSLEAKNANYLSVEVDSGLYNMITASVEHGNMPLQNRLEILTELVMAKNYSVDYTLAEEMETEIALEEWMLSAQSNYWKDVYADKEDAIKLEDWMMNASLW